MNKKCECCNKKSSVVTYDSYFSLNLCEECNHNMTLSEIETESLHP